VIVQIQVEKQSLSELFVRRFSGRDPQLRIAAIESVLA
jgi:hypothetical protein